MTQPTTPATTGLVRPGTTSGTSTEFTVIFPLKPGGAERLREVIFKDLHFTAAEKLSTLHEARLVIIDNDTRLLFASTFDGTWDQYIDDFGSELGQNLDALFQDCEGYPGLASPEVKDYVLKYQVEAGAFYTAYPEATVKQLKKGQRVLKAWEEMLDTAVE